MYVLCVPRDIKKHTYTIYNHFMCRINAQFLEDVSLVRLDSPNRFAETIRDLFVCQSETILFCNIPFNLGKFYCNVCAVLFFTLPVIIKLFWYLNYLLISQK